jgi:hypothetical protein
MTFKKIKIVAFALALPFLSFAQGFDQVDLEGGNYLIADFDKDGKSDLLVEFYNAFSYDLLFRKNEYTSTGKFTTVTTIKNVTTSSGFVALDYDQDGDDDVVYSDSKLQALMLLVNKGNLVFTQEKLTLKQATRLLVGDADKDGIKEIYAYSSIDKTIDLITVKEKKFSSNNLVKDIYIDDMQLVNLNTTPEDELLIAPNASFKITFAYVEKTGSTYTYKTGPLTIPEDGLNQMVIVDINKDGTKDVVIAGELAITALILDQNGVATRKKLIPYTGSTFFGFTAITVADFNGDGKLDIVTTDRENILLFTNNGDNTYQQSAISSVSPASDYTANDIDGDNDLDLFVNNGDLWLLINNITQLPNATKDYNTQPSTLNPQPFKCYPNPVNDILYITFPQSLNPQSSILNPPSNYSIYDITDKLIQSGNFDGEGVDVSELSSGSYMIKVGGKEGVFVNRFLKR